MLWALLRRLQRKHNFKHYTSKIFRDKYLTMQQEKDFLKWLTVTKNAKKHVPFAMDRHMYFIDAEAHSVEKGEKVDFTPRKGKYVFK